MGCNGQLCMYVREKFSKHCLGFLDYKRGKWQMDLQALKCFIFFQNPKYFIQSILLCYGFHQKNFYECEIMGNFTKKKKKIKKKCLKKKSTITTTKSHGWQCIIVQWSQKPKIKKKTNVLSSALFCHHHPHHPSPSVSHACSTRW